MTWWTTRRNLLVVMEAAAVVMAALPGGASAFPTIDPWRVMPAATALPAGDTVATPCPARPLTDGITLAQAVTQALCANPQSRQAWAQAQAQGAVVGQAYAAFLPTVQLSINRSRDTIDTRSDGPPAQRSRSDIHATGRNATFNLLMLDFGARAAQVHQAEHNLAAALASHEGTVQAVLATAAQSYFEVAAAQGALVAARETEQSTQESWQAARAREANGSVVRAETLRAQTAYSQAVANRIKTEGGLRMAYGALANVMGLDARTPLTLDTATADNLLAGATTEDTQALLQGLDRLIDEALSEQPAVRAARSQLAASQARLDAAIAEGYPSLSVNVGRYINGRPNNQLSPLHSYETLSAVTLSVPLFEGFARNYKIKEAMAQVEMRRAELDAARSQASLDVWRHYQTLQTETASMHAAADLLHSGQEAFEATQARYDAGAVNLLELMDARKAYSEARQERIRAVAAWHSARLRLLASLGRAGFWAVEAPQASTQGFAARDPSSTRSRLSPEDQEGTRP